MRKQAAALIVAASMLASPASYARWGSSRGGGAARGPANRSPSLPVYRGRVYSVPIRSGTYVAQGRSLRAGIVTPSVPQRSNWWFHHSAPSTQRPSVPGQASKYTPTPTHAVQFRAPAFDQKGRALSARPVTDMSKGAALVRQTVANPDFARTVQSLTAADSERDGQFHWYSRAGVKISHWHDDAHGRDWFGFYRGGSALWTVSWHDHFWWQEPHSGRWLVFWRDQWWWRAPDGSSYVYLGDQFYQWQPTATGAVLTPAPMQAPPAAAPTGTGAEGLVVSSRPEFNYSADGTRMVQVEGEKLSAYLYDTTRLEPGGGSRFLKELGEGVTAVNFSDTSAGEPLRITLSVQDPTGAIRQVVLDADGNPVSGSVRTAPPPTPVMYGTKGGKPGFDAPAATEQPPTESPYPDGN